jgi:hypothetical protein
LGEGTGRGLVLVQGRQGAAQVRPRTAMAGVEFQRVSEALDGQVGLTDVDVERA